MRKIGIQEIEDIALGAALLGAGGGGDPYIGKLTAIGAVKECGEVELIGADEDMQTDPHSSTAMCILTHRISSQDDAMPVAHLMIRRSI